jgi:HK97 family phage major capsid protein
MEIPPQWQDGSVFLMNSRTAALLMTMSDAMARPLFSALPERAPGFTFAGSPIIICTWMPNVEPGSCPILFGNLRQTYTLVDRRAVTMQVDPYSGGYCTIFRFEARCGGATTCPNASRLLRIK